MSAYVISFINLKVFFFAIMLKIVLAFATNFTEPLQLRENYEKPELDLPWDRYIVSSGNIFVWTAAIGLLLPYYFNILL